MSFSEMKQSGHLIPTARDYPLPHTGKLNECPHRQFSSPCSLKELGLFKFSPDGLLEEILRHPVASRNFLNYSPLFLFLFF